MDPLCLPIRLAALLLTFGKLSDIKGRKLLFTGGFALFTAASGLCGLSKTGTELIIFRVIQGISASMIRANFTAIVTYAFPPENRGKALGANILAVYTGLAVGTKLGGILVQSIGWPSIFYVNVPIGLIVSLIAATKLNESATHRKPNEPFDLWGAATFTIALTFILLGLTLTGTTSWTSPSVYGPLINGSILIFLFLYIKLKRKETAH